MENMTTIGERIKEARNNAKMNQPELAKIVGLSKSAVSQWEKGDVKGLKPENLVKVAQILHVDVTWLAMGKQPRLASKPLSAAMNFDLLRNIIELLESATATTSIANALSPHKKAFIICHLYKQHQDDPEALDISDIQSLVLIAT